MGDSGALLLGLLLAASTISLTGSTDPAVLSARGLAPAFVPLLLPVAALLVPVADVGLAVLRRTAAGRSPFAPDKQHLHHRMLEIGHGHRAAVALLHAWVAVLALGTVATAFWPWRDVLVVCGAVVVVVAVLTVVPLLVRRVQRMPVTPDGDVASETLTEPPAGVPATTTGPTTATRTSTTTSTTTSPSHAPSPEEPR